jgi:hypothetical protein
VRQQPGSIPGGGVDINVVRLPWGRRRTEVVGMTEQQSDPGDVKTSERMATLAAAKADAIGHKVRGQQQTEPGRRYEADPAEVAAAVEQWPAAPKKVARQLVEQYGAPNEATPTKLIWYRNGFWKRTVLSRDEIVHNFPTSHTDFLTQYIDYRVPVDMFDDLAAFDGSCLADRTAGEVAARCDSEAMNILTLNLMHEIVTGRRTVDEARQVYAENAAAYTMGRPAPYTERLQFALPNEQTGDPDEAMIAGAMGRQVAGKAKDVVSGER